MSKILEKLIDKAEANGTASINGRMYDPSSRSSEVLREKWAIENDGTKLTLRHWGTKILTISLNSHEVLYIKRYSMSDQNGMNSVMQHYGYQQLGKHEMEKLSK